MKILLAAALLALSLVVIYSCKSSKSVVENTGMELQNFEITKGSCRGKCKRYSFTINGDRQATFKGKKNMEWIGDYKTTMDISSFNLIKEKMAALKIENLDNDYLATGTRDLQMTTIIYNDKIIKFHKRKAPEALLNFVNEMENLINDIKWSEI